MNATALSATGLASCGVDALPPVAVTSTVHCVDLSSARLDSEIGSARVQCSSYGSMCCASLALTLARCDQLCRDAMTEKGL